MEVYKAWNGQTFHSGRGGTIIMREWTTQLVFRLLVFIYQRKWQNTFCPLLSSCATKFSLLRDPEGEILIGCCTSASACRLPLVTCESAYSPEKHFLWFLPNWALVILGDRFPLKTASDEDLVLLSPTRSWPVLESVWALAPGDRLLWTVEAVASFAVVTASVLGEFKSWRKLFFVVAVTSVGWCNCLVDREDRLLPIGENIPDPITEISWWI